MVRRGEFFTFSSIIFSCAGFQESVLQPLLQIRLLLKLDPDFYQRDKTGSLSSGSLSSGRIRIPKSSKLNQDFYKKNVMNPDHYQIV